MEESCFSGRSWVLGDWERGLPRAWKLETEYFKQTSTVCVPVSPAHPSDNQGHVITRLWVMQGALLPPYKLWQTKMSEQSEVPAAGKRLWKIYSTRYERQKRTVNMFTYSTGKTLRAWIAKLGETQPQYCAWIWILNKIHNMSSKMHTAHTALKILSFGELV